MKILRRRESPSAYFVAILLWVLFLFCVVPGFAAEVKRCDVAPWPLPVQATHAMTPVSGSLYPFLPSGQEMPWGTAGAALLVVVAGPSTGVNMGGGITGGLQSRFGNATGKGKQIKYVVVAQGGETTREWADPNSHVWQDAIDELAAKGYTPEQVGVWIHVQGVTFWAEQGRMTEAMVTQVMANAKDKFANVQTFIHTDLPPAQWAWRMDGDVPEAGGTSIENIPYEAGELIRHPNTKSVVGDGYLLATMALNQTGSPAGVVQEAALLAGLPWDCLTDYKPDGSHLTGSGQGGGGIKAGIYLTNQIYPWLRLWVPWAH